MAQKINGSTFQIFEIILVNFQIENKLGKTQFFQETFLITDTSIALILDIFSLIFSNKDILFVKQKFI